MTVQELIDELMKKDRNAQVIIGCQGYTNTPDDDIRVMTTGSKIYIADSCYYPEID